MSDRYVSNLLKRIREEAEAAINTNEILCRRENREPNDQERAKLVLFRKVIETVRIIENWDASHPPVPKQ